jgi:hypothetical protein
MFFMITSIYPPTKASEVVKVFGKSLAEPLPSFLKRLHVLSAGGVGEPGIRTYSIFEADKGKEYDALAELTKRMAWFYHIEGWRYQIETLFTAEEAIPILGVQMP